MDHKHKCKSLTPKNLQKNAQKILTTLADIDFLSNIKKKKETLAMKGKKGHIIALQTIPLRKRKGQLHTVGDNMCHTFM